MKKGELVFFCGKMGAGISTKANEISRDRNAVLLSEDEWLEWFLLYFNKDQTLEDYSECLNQFRHQIKKLVQSILTTGTDVVMDFYAGTVSDRDWFREIYTEVNAPHNLVYLDIPNEICLKQLAKKRIEQPERSLNYTVEMFEVFTKKFTEPAPNEGFNITKIVQNV